MVSPFPKLRSQAKIAVGEDHRPHRPCEIQEGTAFLARAPIDTPTGGHAGYVLEQSRKVLQHKLSDIAVYHDAKVKIRLVPTRAEFVEKFGRTPPLLDQAIAGGG